MPACCRKKLYYSSTQMQAEIETQSTYRIDQQ